MPDPTAGPCGAPNSECRCHLPAEHRGQHRCTHGPFGADLPIPRRRPWCFDCEGPIFQGHGDSKQCRCVPGSLAQKVWGAVSRSAATAPAVPDA